jgi:hypothetical protein
MPALLRPARICSRIGRPCTFNIGFGVSFVSSLMRVPFPAARMTAFIYFGFAICDCRNEVQHICQHSHGRLIDESRPKLIEHPGVRLHEAEQVFCFEHAERSHVRAGFRESLELVGTGAGRSEQDRLRVP